MDDKAKAKTAVLSFEVEGMQFEHEIVELSEGLQYDINDTVPGHGGSFRLSREQDLASWSSEGEKYDQKSKSLTILWKKIEKIRTVLPHEMTWMARRQ